MCVVCIYVWPFWVFSSCLLKYIWVKNEDNELEVEKIRRKGRRKKRKEKKEVEKRKKEGRKDQDQEKTRSSEIDKKKPQRQIDSQTAHLCHLWPQCLPSLFSTPFYDPRWWELKQLLGVWRARGRVCVFLHFFCWVSVTLSVGRHRGGDRRTYFIFSNFIFKFVLLDTHLDFFADDLGVVSDERGKLSSIYCIFGTTISRILELKDAKRLLLDLYRDDYEIKHHRKS